MSIWRLRGLAVRSVLLAALLALVLPVAVLGAEPGIGTIEGRLVIGTSGGGKTGGIEVVLIAYQNRAEVLSLTTTTSPDGFFSFTGLTTDSTYLYQASARFLDSDYHCEPFHFSSQQTSKTVEITVYETTESDAAIRIAMAHTVVYPVDSGIQVEKYYVVLNEGDRTFTGSKPSSLKGKKETLRFFIPREAVETEYLLGLESCCVVTTANGIADTSAVTPGGREIAYSYRIPAGSGAFALSETLEYPAARYDLLIGGEGIRGTSEQLADKGKRDIRGMTFEHFSGTGLDRGQSVSVQLSGLPGGASRANLLWAVLALAGVGAVFGVLHLMKRKRLQPATVEDAGSLRKDELLARIARLDDDFSSGVIPEADYRRLRGEAKAELVGLMSEKDGER